MNEIAWILIAIFAIPYYIVGIMWRIKCIKTKPEKEYPIHKHQWRPFAARIDKESKIKIISDFCSICGKEKLR